MRICRFLSSLMWILCSTTFLVGQIFTPVNKSGSVESHEIQASSTVLSVDTFLLEKALHEDLYIEIPSLPQAIHFSLHANDLIPEAIKEKYNYHSWDAISKDEKFTGKVDFTQHGIRAYFRSKEEIIYLEPLEWSNKTSVQIFVYPKTALISGSKSNPHKKDHESAFECWTIGEDLLKNQELSLTDGIIGTNRRILDIAIASTGEYTRYYGGAVADGLSGIITTMNRVNAVFEKELALSFRLVPDNERIVFTDPSTDPYTNGNLSRMINENQSTLNTIIGSSNYDIGHVFGTAGGGFARISSVCRSTDKAKGVTGLLSPQGDIFNVDYVCHELGHQLGAQHTFNNCDGSWGGNHSYEPGSGTSIMSYAGICGSTDVQAYSDQHFHLGSLLQMNNVLNSCAEIENPNNHYPEVFIQSPTNKIAPISTPFFLEGFALDADGEPLKYSWDQMDVSAVQPYGESNQDGPLFRFFKPSSSQTIRYFPNLQDLATGDHLAETLPATSRTVNFNFTARDEHEPVGAVAYKEYSLEFDEHAGPFQITYPNQENIQFQEGERIVISWDVSNTHLDPINCNLVSILLSVNDGHSYDQVLIEVTANDGSAEVVLPFISSRNCRIMVKAVDHLFFNITEHAFEIGENPEPEVALILTDSVFSLCNEDLLEFNFRVEGYHEYPYLTELHVDRLPTFLQIDFDPSDPFQTDRNIHARIRNISFLSPGEYPFEIIAQSTNGWYSDTTTIVINVQDNTPPAPQWISPISLESFENNTINYSWQHNPLVDRYHLQVAADPLFNELVLDTLLLKAVTQMDFIAPSFGVLYSRISGINLCGEGRFSSILNNHVFGENCRRFSSLVNQEIPEGMPTFNLFEIEVEEAFSVETLQLQNISGTHDNTAVLEFNLIYPEGSKKSLITLPCLDENQYLFGISDISNYPFSCPFNRNITYQGEERLNDLLPMSSRGTWGLEIINNDATMSGFVEGWTLDLCGSSITDPTRIQKKRDNWVQVPLAAQSIIHDDHLWYESSGFPSGNIVLKIKSLPLYGKIFLRGEELKVNDWVSQEDLMNRLFSYQHIETAYQRDSFLFDVLIHNVGVLENETMDIFIASSDMSATVSVLNPISCPDLNNGSVSISASGGVPPYEYGIQGLAYQNDSIFDGLSSDYYIFTVRDQTSSEIALPGILLSGKDPFTMNYTQNGRDLVFHVTGGSPPYAYSLDGGLLTTDSSFQQLNNGAHRLKVLDANSCEKSFFFEFNFKSVELQLKRVLPLRCHNSNNGTIAVGAYGGKKPYRFSINDGPLTGDSLFNQLMPGIYKVKVLDALNEFDQIDQLEILTPEPITASANVLGQDIYINASGGTGQYVYRINNGSFTTQSVFLNVPYGSHIIEIKDQNSCSVQIEVNVLEQPINIQYQWNRVLDCHQDSTAELEVFASGGYPPYSYALDPNNYQSSSIFNQLPANVYNIYVRDQQNQTQVLSGIQLIDPSPIHLTVENSNDSLFVSLSGGSPPYSISVDGAPFSYDTLFLGLSQGSHHVRVIDANNCEATLMFTINRSPLNVSANVFENPKCWNSDEGVILVSGSGGLPPYQYSLDNLDYQDDPMFSGLSARTYVAYLKDADGNIGLSDPVSVQAPLPLVANIFTRNDTAEIEAFGGTPPILSSINGSAFDSVHVYTGLEPGIQELWLRDANGCEKMIEFSIKTTDQQEQVNSLFHIYPNPIREQIFVEYKKSDHDPVSVNIYNALGKVVYTEDLKDAFSIMNVDHLPTGSYWLELKMAHHSYRKVIVVVE